MNKAVVLQETSVQSNTENKESGNKRKELDKLKNLYKMNPQGLIDQEIADILHTTTALVSARRNDLMQECTVANIGRRRNKISNRMNIVWTVLESKSLFDRKETPKQRLNSIINTIETWKKSGTMSAADLVNHILNTAKA